MQLALIPDDRFDRIVRIHQDLRRRYGQPGPFRLLDPISQLVMGLIGGRTRGEVTLAAFTLLLRRFFNWEALRDAPVAEIERCIAAVTYADVKAPRLKAALLAITVGQGRLSLDALEPMSVEAALAWLERLPGVGRKTAASVLNFSTLRKTALVIDTHHLRVLRRLGLVGPRTVAEEAFDRLTPLMPLEWTPGNFDEHHQLMKTHGQKTCRPTNPACTICPLNQACPHAAINSSL